MIGSIRRACLDHVIVLHESHRRPALRSYLPYYHRTRTHLGLDKDTPDRRPVAETAVGRIVAVPEVGGLHHALRATRRVARTVVSPSPHQRSPKACPFRRGLVFADAQEGRRDRVETRLQNVIETIPVDVDAVSRTGLVLR